MSSAATKHDNSAGVVTVNRQVRKHALSPAMKSVTIIVPTRNEVENIGPLVSQIVASAIPFHEILFVDDGSIDGTRDLIRSLSSIHSIRLIDQDRAVPGLAAAVMAGARAAGGRLLRSMDAERSPSPARIKDLFRPLFNGTA